jgi:hypothetical protein
MDGGVVSSPTASDGELYVGTDGGSVVAIGPAASDVARLAVYFDSTTRERAFMQGSRLAFEYFRGLGYTALDKDSLPSFLRARVRDGAPSAVVFATDAIPASLRAGGADSVLVRTYLESGGKVVWLSFPMGGLMRDADGNPIGFDGARAGAFLGMDFSSFDYGELSEHVTSAGTNWGLSRWVAGRFMLDTAAVSRALMVDHAGKTSTWIRTYRADRPGAGYVQLWGFGANADRLPFIRAAAEYGLLRAANKR